MSLDETDKLIEELKKYSRRSLWITFFAFAVLAYGWGGFLIFGLFAGYLVKSMFDFMAAVLVLLKQ